MGLIQKKTKIQIWIICPKCKINIPKIYKYSQNNSNTLTLAFECLCYETIFQMSLISYLSILNAHYANSLSMINKHVVSCLNCNLTVYAEIYCIECSGYLCKKCDSFHSNNYSHNYSSTQTIINSKCQLHKYINTLYCITCEKEICFKCKKDQNHLEHCVSSIKDYCKSTKNKWTFNSIQSITEVLNPDKPNNKELFALLEILYANYELLIDTPSINITKSITTLQKEISSLCLNFKKENTISQSQIIIKPQALSKYLSLYQVQYHKALNKKEIINSPYIITVLIILTDGRYAFVKSEINNPLALYSISISVTFTESSIELPEQYSDVIDLIEFNPDTLILGLRIGQIDIWSISSQIKIKTFINQTQVISLIKINEEKIYLIGKIGSIWNIKTNKKIDSYALGTVISFNNYFFISYRKSIQIWDINKNNNVLELKEYQTFIVFVGKINNVRIISSSIDGIIKIWNIKHTKSIKTITLPNIIIEKGIISKEKEIIYLVTNDKSILIYDYGVYQINTIVQMQHYINRIIQIDNKRICCLVNNMNKIHIITN